MPAYRKDLSRSHENLGILLAGRGNLRAADEQFRKALAIQEKLAAEFPLVPQYRVDLGGNYCNFGILVGKSGQPGENLEWFDKAIRILTDVYEQGGSSGAAKQGLRNSHWNRAMVYDRLRKFAEAIKDWEKAIELSRAEDIPQLRRKLAQSHNGLGDLLAGLGKRPEAEEQFRKALAIQEKLAAEFPAGPDYRKDLADCYNNLGNLLPASGSGRRRRSSIGKPWRSRRSWSPSSPPCRSTASTGPAATTTWEICWPAWGSGRRRKSSIGKPWRSRRSWSPSSPRCRNIESTWVVVTAISAIWSGTAASRVKAWSGIEKAIRTLTAVYEQDRRSGSGQTVSLQ